MTEQANTRVILVDDHAVVRQGLKTILNGTTNVSVVGEAGSGLDGIKLSRQLEFDLLILELSLHDRNGIEVLKQIKKELPHINVLIFSHLPETQYAVRSHKAGAAGYLNKQASELEILTAVRQIASGMKYISVQLAQELANNLSADYQDDPHRALSDREYQTLLLIASGKSVSDIAKELSLSSKTISEYRARILLKMKLRHNAELTHYAIKNQLVE